MTISEKHFMEMKSFYLVSNKTWELGLIRASIFIIYIQQMILIIQFDTLIFKVAKNTWNYTNGFHLSRPSLMRQNGNLSSNWLHKKMHVEMKFLYPTPTRTKKDTIQYKWKKLCYFSSFFSSFEDKCIKLHSQNQLLKLNYEKLSSNNRNL